MTRKLIDEYELWGLKLNVKKLSHGNEYTYFGVSITKDGNHEPEINDRIED